MTKKELSQIYYLKREISDLQRRLAHMQEKAVSTTQTISGMPLAGIGSDKSSLGADIADIKKEIEIREQRVKKEHKRLEKYISSIDDSFIRQILIFRFIDLDRWSNVAYRIGGNNTEDSVKKAFYRFLKE